MDHHSSPREPQCFLLKLSAYIIPCLLQFVNTMRNFTGGFDVAEFGFFRERVSMEVCAREEAKMHDLSLTID